MIHKGYALISLDNVLKGVLPNRWTLSSTEFTHGLGNLGQLVLELIYIVVLSVPSMDIKSMSIEEEAEAQGSGEILGASLRNLEFSPQGRD